MTRARDLAAFVSNADGDIKFDTDTLFIDSSTNRVGIGTTTPDTSFHIETTAPIISLVDSNSFTDANDRAQIRASSDKMNFQWYDDSASTTTELMAITNDNKVGIGTTSPLTALHVSSGTSGDCVVRIEADTDNNDEGDTPSILFAQDGGVTLNRIGVEGNSGTAFTNSLGNNLYLLAGGTTLGIDFATNGAARGRFDPSGNFMVGKTAVGSSIDGCELRNGGSGYTAAFTSDAANTSAVVSIMHNASTLPAKFIEMRDSSGNVKGIMGVSTETNSTGLWIGFGDTGLSFQAEANNAISPVNANNGVNLDNVVDMGAGNGRFDDIRATNGTIQTSDENDKQNIESLTSAEITAATAISKLFKTYKWKDKVEAKGNNARTHTGVVAQQVQTAMLDAGLDVTKYAFWCADTWWEADRVIPATEAVEEDGIEAVPEHTITVSYNVQSEAPEGATERTRLGIRYPELLSFIGAATEQRLTSIEARLDALEA